MKVQIASVEGTEDLQIMAPMLNEESHEFDISNMGRRYVQDPSLNVDIKGKQSNPYMFDAGRSYNIIKEQGIAKFTGKSNL